MPKDPSYLGGTAPYLSGVIIQATDPVTGQPIQWSDFGDGSEDPPDVSGIDMGKDLRAFSAFCTIYAPLDRTPDGAGGVSYGYDIIAEGIPAVFKTFSNVSEGLVNGAVRTRERWGQVFFEFGNDVQPMYRILADDQFYEVLDTSGNHDNSNSGTLCCTVARIGPNDENDV